MRTWVGTARGADGKGRVTVVSEVLAAAGALACGRRRASHGHRDAPAGRNVFESPSVELRPGTPPQRVSFDADAGSLDVKIVLADREGKTIDRETRAIDVPDYSGRAAALGTPRFHRPRTLREFQTLAADADAIPVTTRDFARTDRLLIRFDAFGAGGEQVAPTAAILSRAGRKMFDVQVVRLDGSGCITSNRSHASGRCRPESICSRSRPRRPDLGSSPRFASAERIRDYHRRRHQQGAGVRISRRLPLRPVLSETRHRQRQRQATKASRQRRPARPRHEREEQRAHGGSDQRGHRWIAARLVQDG